MHTYIHICKYLYIYTIDEYVDKYISIFLNMNINLCPCKCTDATNQRIISPYMGLALQPYGYVPVVLTHRVVRTVAFFVFATVKEHCHIRRNTCFPEVRVWPMYLCIYIHIHVYLFVIEYLMFYHEAIYLFS
jgi:hypothetical protein